MTSNKFLDIAKEKACEVLREKHGIDVPANEVEPVWFAHELGYKKCTLYHKDFGHWYPEVTYNRDSKELYIDWYLKQSNTKFTHVE